MRQGQLRAILGYLYRVANPNGSEPNDAELLDRWLKHRDPMVFEVLVWRHGAMVWNVCRRILRHEPDVEDAFQATFLTFLRKANRIGQGRFLGSWLYKVAYRTALNARTASARRKVHEQLDGQLPHAATAAADGWDELAPVLDEEVNRLPEKYRRPFVLCYLEGKTTDEAAQDLGCPRGTVGTRLAWARKRLRARLTRRGVALSTAALATLLVEKAASGSAPGLLVASAVRAASYSTAGEALAAGVVSAHAAALSQGVLQGSFMAKLNATPLLFVAVGVLGSGVGLLAQRAPAHQRTHEISSSRSEPTEERPIALARPGDADVSMFPPSDVEPAAESDVRVADLTPGNNEPSEPLPISGTVLRVDGDGRVVTLAVNSKFARNASQKDIEITDRTRLVFSNVGGGEAKLTARYTADVWLEKGGKDVAARVHLRGFRSPKKAPDLAGRVATVAAAGRGMTLERPVKGEPAEKVAIWFTDQTRVLFSNVPRGGARIDLVRESQVWLEDHSPDTAKSVMVFGTAEEKPTGVKKEKADRSGRVVAVSADEQILTLETDAGKDGSRTKAEIRIAGTTRECYYGVAADGARPTVGYLAQVWLDEGSENVAARVRFFGHDPRRSVDAIVVAVSGERLTVATAPKVKGGEIETREIAVTPKTKLSFFNVGPGGAQMTQGDHVRGWLVEGSDDTADELTVSRLTKSDDTKAAGNGAGDRKADENR
jgi:RNA polymerase sigma factor (sigma-70 family)